MGQPNGKRGKTVTSNTLPGFSMNGSVVKSLRYKSEGPGIAGVAGIFPVASDRSICPGANSASKSEYQDTPGGKGGRCVRLTIYHLHVPIVKKSGGLNLLGPCGPVQACNGRALAFAA